MTHCFLKYLQICHVWVFVSFTLYTKSHCLREAFPETWEEFCVFHAKRAERKHSSADYVHVTPRLLSKDVTFNITKLVLFIIKLLVNVKYMLTVC